MDLQLLASWARRWDIVGWSQGDCVSVCVYEMVKLTKLHKALCHNYVADTYYIP